jgi:predicted GNAT family acetyltransferase
MFRDNASERRYEFETPAGLVIANYRDEGALRVIAHVETPMAVRGKGCAARLMDEIVAHARTHGLKLHPVCSYADAYFKRTPGAGDVLA